MKLIALVALCTSVLLAGCTAGTVPSDSAPPAQASSAAVGSSDPSAAPPDGVQLLTGPLGCYAGGESGPAGTLEADPEYGTRFDGKPVMWPAGYTAVRAGDEVLVRDPAGNARATTGRRYYISFAATYGQAEELIENLGIEVFPAAAGCDYPWDFVDCATLEPGGRGMDRVDAACAGAGSDNRRAAPRRVT